MQRRVKADSMPINFSHCNSHKETLKINYQGKMDKLNLLLIKVNKLFQDQLKGP